MKCEFCGRELRVKVAFNGMRVPMPCDCPESLDYIRAEDKREWQEERDRVLRHSIATAKIPPKFRVYPEYGDGSSAYLYGEQGRGKTERACGILRKYLNDGIEEVAHNRFFQTRTAKFVSVPDWLMQMKKTYDTRGSSEADIMDIYAGVGLLCLDDLGKGQMTPWAIERIYTLINKRYSTERPIVVTSQYDGQALVQRLSERGDGETAMAIWSRLSEMCKVGRVTGRDRRLG